MLRPIAAMTDCGYHRAAIRLRSATPRGCFGVSLGCPPKVGASSVAKPSGFAFSKIRFWADVSQQ
jgi:hypothetical protein